MRMVQPVSGVSARIPRRAIPTAETSTPSTHLPRSSKKNPVIMRAVPMWPSQPLLATTSDTRRTGTHRPQAAPCTRDPSRSMKRRSSARGVLTRLAPTRIRTSTPTPISPAMTTTASSWFRCQATNRRTANGRVAGVVERMSRATLSFSIPTVLTGARVQATPTSTATTRMPTHKRGLTTSPAIKWATATACWSRSST